MKAITARVISEVEGYPVVGTVAEWLPRARLWCLTFDCPKNEARRTTRARADKRKSITVEGEAATIRFDTDTGTLAIRGAACVNVDFRLREVCKGMDRGRLQELFETIVFSLTNG